MDSLQHHPSLFGLWIGDSAQQVPRREISDGDGYPGYCVENSRVGRRRTAEDPFEDMSDEIYSWQDEQAMEETLGKTHHQEITAFSEVFYYTIETQNVSVHWSTNHPRKNLDRIIVGGEVIAEPQFTALDFVRELSEAWIDLEKYQFQEPPASARPALIRYQRVRALAAALGLPSVESVANGSFLDDRRELERRNDVLKQLESSSSLHHSDGRQPPPLHHVAKKVFLNLLSYRCKAEPLFSHNSGWLQVSDPTLVAMIGQTQSDNGALREELEPIEQLLARLVDPAQRSFRQSWLAETHGFNIISPQQFDTAWAWGFGFDIEE